MKVSRPKFGQTSDQPSDLVAAPSFGAPQSAPATSAPAAAPASGEQGEYKSKRDEIGVAWSKPTRHGDNLLTVRMEKEKLKALIDSADGEFVRLVAYANKTKTEKQPDYRIYEDTFKPSEQAAAPRKTFGAV